MYGSIGNHLKMVKKVQTLEVRPSTTLFFKKSVLRTHTSITVWSPFQWNFKKVWEKQTLTLFPRKSKNKVTLEKMIKIWPRQRKSGNQWLSEEVCFSQKVGVPKNNYASILLVYLYHKTDSNVFEVAKLLCGTDRISD